MGTLLGSGHLRFGFFRRKQRPVSRESLVEHFRFHGTLSHTVTRGRFPPVAPGSQNITVRDWLFVAAPFEHHRNHRVHWTSHLTALRGEPFLRALVAPRRARPHGKTDVLARTRDVPPARHLFHFSPFSTRLGSHLAAKRSSSRPRRVKLTHRIFSLLLRRGAFFGG